MAAAAAGAEKHGAAMKDEEALETILGGMQASRAGGVAWPSCALDGLLCRRAGWGRWVESCFDRAHSPLKGCDDPHCPPPLAVVCQRLLRADERGEAPDAARGGEPACCIRRWQALAGRHRSRPWSPLPAPHALACGPAPQIHVQAVKSGGKFLLTFFKTLPFWSQLFPERQEAFQEMVSWQQQGGCGAKTWRGRQAGAASG